MRARLLAVVALALALFVGAASPAAAYDDGAIPLDGTTFGLTAAQMETSAPGTASGGWYPSNKYVQTGQWINPAGSIFVRHWGSASEVYWNGTQPVFDVIMRFPTSTGAPYFNHAFSFRSTSYCSAGATGLTLTARTVVTQTGQPSARSELGDNPDTRQVKTAACLAGAPYLHAVKFEWGQTYSDGTWLSHGRSVYYPGAVFEGGNAYDPLEPYMCEIFPDMADCAPPHGAGDPFVPAAAGTDFAVVCAGAPEATWMVWDWLGPWVGHYARCLWEPSAGWDPDGQINQAYQSGSVAEVVRLVGAFTAVEWTGSCGVIGTGAIQGQTLAVDTCAPLWGQFAPVRTALAVGVVLYAGFTALNLLLAALGFKAITLGKTEGSDD